MGLDGHYESTTQFDRRLFVRRSMLALSSATPCHTYDISSKVPKQTLL